jgi:hypothetical protein
MLQSMELDPEYKGVFPPLGEEHYLVGLWERVGYCSNFGNGAVPLTWSEINNWMQATGTTLSTWEVETLASMSRLYAQELHSTEVNRAMPYIENNEDVQRSLNVKWKSFFEKQKINASSEIIND